MTAVADLPSKPSEWVGLRFTYPMPPSDGRKTKVRELVVEVLSYCTFTSQVKVRNTHHQSKEVWTIGVQTFRDKATPLPPKEPS